MTTQEDIIRAMMKRRTTLLHPGTGLEQALFNMTSTLGRLARHSIEFHANKTIDPAFKDNLTSLGAIACHILESSGVDREHIASRIKRAQPPEDEEYGKLTHTMTLWVNILTVTTGLLASEIAAISLDLPTPSRIEEAAAKTAVVAVQIIERLEEEHPQT